MKQIENSLNKIINYHSSSSTNEKKKENKGELILKVLISIILLFLISSNISFVTDSSSSITLRDSNTFRKSKSKRALSSRLQSLLQTKNNLIGNNLHSIKYESNTIQNITQVNNMKTHYTMPGIINYLTYFLQELHKTIETNKNYFTGFMGVWDVYYNLVEKTIYPWDVQFMSFLKKEFYNVSSPFYRRKDDSIFLSIASYRDENCMSTLSNAFQKAKDPDKLYVGLIQQNCIEDCFSGVLVGGKVEPIEPDDDCYAIFCKEHPGLCGNVRVLYVNETESLGPYTARYFASRLWYGETWFVQLDSHMTFAQDWDAHVVSMLKNAPSNKPVITHYPPSYETDLDENINDAAQRLCGPVISSSDIDDEIIIMIYSSSEIGHKATDIPKFAPVIAAGFFATTPEFLLDVPFDMFLPWVFTGEEIIMSARFFTHGYDIFAPTRNVIGHIYERRHKPKFWEVFDHIFGNHKNYYNPLSRVIMKRIKYQLGYPESARDFIVPSSILAHVEDYTLGGVRTLESYMEMATIDLTYKFTRNPEWCQRGIPPPNVPEYQQFAHLYGNTKK